MNFIQRLGKNGDKITFYYDYGRGPGQRPSTGIFTFVLLPIGQRFSYA